MEFLEARTLIGRKRFDSYVDAVETVISRINIYNTKRPHSTINMMSPLDYETQLHNHAQEVTF